jgi:sialidase-1
VCPDWVTLTGSSIDRWDGAILRDAVEGGKIGRMLRIVDQGTLSHTPGRGAYMPWITPLTDGTWIASQHVGTGLGTDDNHIVVLRSRDGRTFTEQGRIGPVDDGFAYRAPQISVVDADATGRRLVLTCTRFATADDTLFDPDSEALARADLSLFWSGDGGDTWTPEPQIVPVDLPRERYNWNSAGQLLQLPAAARGPGRWMWPIETWKPEGWAGPPDQRAWALFSDDAGATWGDLTVVANDESGRTLYWDQMNCRLDDGRLCALLWTHLYGTSEDLPNHVVLSDDGGRTWSDPRATTLRGQVCTPIPLADGRVAAIYNDRIDPQGVRLALSTDETLTRFDVDGQATLFDAGAEATFGTTDHENFLAEHMLIAFGKPGGRRLDDGTLLTWFWCTVGGVTHTRWVRLEVSG